MPVTQRPSPHLAVRLASSRNSRGPCTPRRPGRRPVAHRPPSRTGNARPRPNFSAFGSRVVAEGYFGISLKSLKPLSPMARPERFERPTPRFVAPASFAASRERQVEACARRTLWGLSVGTLGDFRCHLVPKQASLHSLFPYDNVSAIPAPHDNSAQNRQLTHAQQLAFVMRGSGVRVT